MRIALVHPTYWPEVRRGSERLVHDLGTLLASRGHDVTLLTSHPAPRTVSVEDGMRVVRSRRLPQPPTLGLHERFLGNVHNVAWQLARGDYDLAHAFFPADAWAAVKARRFGAPPVILSLHGIPHRRYLVNRRYRLEMLRTTVAGAAACTVLSEAAADAFRRFLLHEPRIVPGGVRMDEFGIDRPRAPEPTVLFASSLGDPRKRGELLIAALEDVRGRRPDLRLRVVRTPDPEYGVAPPALPEWVEELDARDTAELAAAYAESWLTVLPSTDEAFGLVLLESLSAGTPVVAADSGALPEIVDSDGIGRLFAPDDRDDLARAIAEALSLAEEPEAVERCRQVAARFDWSRVIGVYEELYADVLG